MLHLLQLTMGPHESALPYTSTPALEMTVFRQHCPRGSIRASTRPISSHRFRHHGSSSLGSASSSSSSSSTTTLPGPSTTSLLGPRLHGATTVPGIMPTYCSYDVACTLYPTYVCRATLYILRWLFFSSANDANSTHHQKIWIPSRRYGDCSAVQQLPAAGLTSGCLSHTSAADKSQSPSRMLHVLRSCVRFHHTLTCPFHCLLLPSIPRWLQL